MSDLRDYRRTYYKRKYHNDEEYREKKKVTNRERYARKTKDCQQCGCRMIKESETNICLSCKLKETEQIKSKRGRKKKVIENKEEFVNDDIEKTDI